MNARIPAAFAALALCCAGALHAQSQDQHQNHAQHQTQNQNRGTTQSNTSGTATQQIEPVVPVGPAVAPAGPGGPVIVPVIPVERLEGVETVTLDTPRGPVVVVSWPTAGPALSEETNVPFNRFDTDRDGMLSRAEVDAAAKNGGAAKRLSTRFDSMDTSRDGKLSFDEAVGWVIR